MNKGLLALGIVGLLTATRLVRADEKADYTELSKLLQKAVVEKAPKQFEDRSEWGRTIPIPPTVRLPRLRRTVVQVNGRDEFPDGIWKRSLVWLDDPVKDIQVRVLDVKKQDANNFRVKLAAVVSIHGERERRRWRNGVQLFALVVQADAQIATEFDCDVKITVDTSKLPPDVIVEPKVVASRLELKNFELRRVGDAAVELSKELGDELKNILQGLLSQREEEVKDYANKALARALKDGKARIPATELLKLKARPKEGK